jgi:hypothetical protein
VLKDFYLAFAPLSFTVLGLWLVIVQTRHSEWRRSPEHQRRAYAVFLYFALPGLMSLIALIDPSSPTLWRVSFAVTAGVGSVGLVLLRSAGRVRFGDSWVLEVSYWIAVLLYLLIAIVAIAPQILSRLDVKPLIIEATLLSLVVFLGVNVAWLLMFEGSRAE